MTWQEYEKFVLSYFSKKYPTSKIEHNIKKIGFNSKTERQIDILIQQFVCGYNIEIVIECKNWANPLDVADVEQFIAKLKDLKITKGAMVSQNGYSAAAKQLALSTGNIQLHILKSDELDSFTGFWGNPYRAHTGVLIFPPNGWIVNAKVPSPFIGDTLCVLHPMGMTASESLKNKECILLNIPYISENEKSLDEMNNEFKEFIKRDEIGIKEFDAKAIFNYWNVQINNNDILFRQTDYSEYTEISGFIYTNYSIIHIWGCCKKEFTNLFVEHMNFIYSELIIIILKGIDLKNCHDDWTHFLQSYIGDAEIFKCIYN